MQKKEIEWIGDDASGVVETFEEVPGGAKITHIDGKRVVAYCEKCRKPMTQVDIHFPYEMETLCEGCHPDSRRKISSLV